MARFFIVVGLARSGKDTFADRLVEKYGFGKYVFSDVLRNELKEKGMEVSKQAMADLGMELRREFGMGVVAERLMESVDLGKDSVLVGPRNIEEIDYVRESAPGLVVVRVDAPKEMRYGRRSGLDAQQIELFFKRDEEDLREKGMGKALEAADFVLDNSGTLGEFERKIDGFMERFK